MLSMPQKTLQQNKTGAYAVIRSHTKTMVVEGKPAPEKSAAEARRNLKPSTVRVFSKISDPANKELFSRESAIKAFSHVFSK
jgi:hypothetical protein